MALQCLKDLKQKYLEKEDCYKSLASLDEMHTKLEELQKQMAWALVIFFCSHSDLSTLLTCINAIFS